MKWSKQQPDRDGLWLWRISGHEGVGVLLLNGYLAKELTVSPPVNYYMVDWNEANKDIETYYVGKE